MTSDFSADELVRDLEGATAIYCERRHIYRVRVDQVTATDDGYMTTKPGSERPFLDTMLQARVTSIATPGLLHKDEPWGIGARFSTLHRGRSYLAATYSRWQLFLSPQTVREALECVSGLPRGMRYIDDYSMRPVVAGRSDAAKVRIDGPTAASLHSCLQSAALEACQTPRP